MKSICQECSKKSICSSLCPEAELYVGQDEVKQREKTIGLPSYGRFPGKAIKHNLTIPQLKYYSRKLQRYIRKRSKHA